MTREAIVQLSDKVRTIVRGDGTMPDLLYDLLTTPTPHGHESALHKFLPFMQPEWEGPKPTVDELGNIILDIGTPKKDFRTVFSCHLDTVHVNHTADIGLMYTLQDGSPDTEGMIYAFTKYVSKDNAEYIAPSILGADDKLGVYIMLQFIENKIPGRYIFHIGEERGGIGSKHIANKTPHVLKNMRRAIAFDRMNYTDAIAFQAGSRCCSTEFSTAMCNEINSHLATRQLQFKPDVRGVWTDTANYVKLVSECTNISVGYFNQHTTQEHFDLVWFKDILLPALLKTNWESLVTVRDKTAKEPEFEYNNNSNYYGHNQNYSSNNFDRVAIKDLTKDTPLYRIPKWHPISGIPNGLPEGTLIRLAEGYVNDNTYKHKEVATTIAALCNVIEGLRRGNREMRKYIVDNGDPVFRNTSIKMNALRRFFNAYETDSKARVIKVDNTLTDKRLSEIFVSIADCMVDFQWLDDDISTNFTKCKEYAKDINDLMERTAIDFYPVQASTPNLRSCYKNLVKLIKTYSSEEGFTKLFKGDKQ